MVVVIRNIIQNSFKYADTDKGVKITLSKNQNGVVIKIRDFGPGIDSMEAEKIFEPFFRSGYTKKISGIGLGLSISKKIMKSKSCMRTKRHGSIQVGFWIRPI